VLLEQPNQLTSRFFLFIFQYRYCVLGVQSFGSKTGEQIQKICDAVFERLAIEKRSACLELYRLKNFSLSLLELVHLNA
jgi:hypothetical protein